MTRPARGCSLVSLCLFSSLVWCAPYAWAQKRDAGAEPTPPKALPNFDIRQAAGPQTAALSAESEARTASYVRKLATVTDDAGRPVRYSLNADGLPKMISSSSGLTAPSSASPESIARRFLASTDGVSPFSQDDLATLRLRMRTSAGSLQIVHLRQYAGDIPVYHSSVKIAVDSEGRVRSAAFSAPAPSLRLLNPLPSLSAAEASRLALESVGVAVESGLEAQPSRNGRALFTHPLGGGRLPVAAEQVAFPLGGGAARLAWRVYADGEEGSFETLIAADDGALLSRVSLVSEVGSGRVFPIDALDSSEIRELGDRWLDDGATVTTGNNVDAYADANGDDEPDASDVPGLQNGRASSPSQQFDFDHGDGRNAGPATRAGAVTNAFYHANAAHDFFYELGFTEVEGNFQTVNFDRGGAGEDSVEVEVHDRDIRNNASFRTRPEGLQARMQLGLYTRVADEVRDSALDGPIIVHEYTHGVTTRTVGGPDDVSCLFNPQGEALGEAWSDYFGLSYYDVTVMGGYASGNLERGVRRAPVDDNPRTYADLGSPVLQEHADGEIWASTLWDIRAALGREATDRLVFQALLLTSCDPTYVDARDAMLAVDGGANEEALWTIFAARGFGFAASGSGTRQSVLTVFNANFDLPPDLAPGNRAPQITSVPASPAEFGEPYSYTVRSIDADGDTRTYELVSGPEGASVNPTTGEMTWTSPTFTAKRFQIAATDGNGGRTIHSFFLRVEATLTPGQPITINGERNSFGLAFVTVPPDTEILQVRLRGDNGDADIVLFDPDFDTEVSFLFGTNETLSIRDPAPGLWAARIDGDLDYENAELSAHLLTPTELEAPGEAGSLSEARTGETFFKVTVPDATALLRVTLTGGSGDPDLFLARGRIPLCGSFLTSLPCDEDESSFAIGPYELLTLENPDPGEYFLTVHGARAYQDVVLRVALSAPDIQLGATTDGAAFQPEKAPGGIATLFGANLTDATTAATSLPLPKELGGVRVVVDGEEAALFFVSPGQINFQFPSDTFGGFADLFVVRNGELSDPLGVEFNVSAPQVFVDPNTMLPVIVHADGSPVTPENPARPGEAIVVYFTGIGFVNDPPEDGEPALADPLSRSLFTPRAAIGGTNATVLFAGLSPGFVGLAQANLMLPDVLPEGTTLPLILIIDTGFTRAQSVPVGVPVAP